MKKFSLLLLFFSIVQNAIANDKEVTFTLRIADEPQKVASPVAPQKKELISFTIKEAGKETGKVVLVAAPSFASGYGVSQAAIVAHALVPFVGPALVTAFGGLVAKTEADAAKDLVGEKYEKLSLWAFSAGYIAGFFAPKVEIKQAPAAPNVNVASVIESLAAHGQGLASPTRSAAGHNRASVSGGTYSSLQSGGGGTGSGYFSGERE